MQGFKARGWITKAIFIVGDFTNTVDFDPGAGTDEHTSNGSDDIFLTKLNADGSYAWTKTWGGTGNEWLYDHNFTINSTGEIAVGTNVSSASVDFDPGDGEAIVEADSDAIAVSILDSDGNFKNAMVWDGDNYEELNSLVLDSNNNLYVLGATCSANLDLNPYASEDVRTLSGNGDMFLTKLTATHYQHSTLSSGIKVTQVSTGSDASKDDEGIERGSNVPLRLSTDTGIPLADFTADMTTDRDWSGITGSSDTTSYQSVVSGLSTAPGVTGTHSLYVPKKDTDTAVHICPDAQTLEQVTADCSNGQTYTEADDNVSIVDVNGTSYWFVSGLSGTGGVSVSGGLADTGTNTPILITIAVLIIASGGVGVVVVRRHR